MDRSFLGGVGGVKQYDLKGGQKKKYILGLKRGEPRNYFKFCSGGICKNANSLPEWQKTSVPYIQKVHIFLGTRYPGPPTLLCTKRQFYPTKMQKSIKACRLYEQNASLREKNSVNHFSFCLCPLSLSFFSFPLFIIIVIIFFWGRGSSQLIWDTRGGGKKLP